MKKVHLHFLIVLALLCLLVWSNQAFAAKIEVYDHFDNGSLDPAWNVTWHNASSWTYTESGTNLTVTDISPADPTSNSPFWVTLDQSFNPVDDFNIDFDFSWTQQDGYETEYLFLEGFGSDGKRLFSFGYHDPQYATTPTENPWGRTFYTDTASAGWWGIEQYGSGSSTFNVSRTDGFVTVFNEDQQIHAGVLEIPLASLSLYISRAYNPDWNPPSYMDSVSVDKIHLTGETVGAGPAATPEPGTLILFGSVLCLSCLFIRRFKRRSI
jgi:hypothetical protein